MFSWNKYFISLFLTISYQIDLLFNNNVTVILLILYRSMDGGIEEDEYASDPIAQQTRQVSR